MIAMSILFGAGLIFLVFGLFLILSFAFKAKHTWAWGIVIFPVIYPVYSILQWAESRVRNGCLISVIGILLVSISIYGGALNVLLSFSERVPDEQLQHRLHELSTKFPQASPPEKPLPNEAEAGAVVLSETEHYDPIYEEEYLSSKDIEPLPPIDDKRIVVPNPKEISYVYKHVELEDLDTFHGRQMKLITNQGDTKIGKLIESNSDYLSLEMPFENGFVTYQYAVDAINDVLVYDTLEH